MPLQFTIMYDLKLNKLRSSTGNWGLKITSPHDFIRGEIIRCETEEELKNKANLIAGKILFHCLQKAKQELLMAGSLDEEDIGRSRVQFNFSPDDED